MPFWGGNGGGWGGGGGGGYSVACLHASSSAVLRHTGETETLLVTTVTEVSPPFRGVPQIWRSRSGYKSIAVSFCDQLVCSRLLATQTRTSARDSVVSARGVGSELAEGGTSAPLGRRGGFSAAANRRVSTVFRPYPRVCRAENCRRNPGEPIILVLYGPWHLFFALFLCIVC